MTRNYGLRANFLLPMKEVIEVFNPEQKQQTEWEINLIGKTYYNHLEIVGDQAIIPDVTNNSFSPISSLKEFSANTLGVGLGLGMVLHMSSESSFGFSAEAGPGFQRQSNIYTDHDEVNYTTATELNSSLDYTWQTAIHGVRTALYFDTISSKVKDVNFDSSNLGLNFAYSYSGF